MVGIMVSFSQNPSFNFQTWSSTLGEPKQPKGWLSANALNIPSFLSNPTSVFKDSLTNANTGYSMKITTVKLSNNPIPGTPPAGLPDTVGLAMTGTVAFSSGNFTIKQGYPDVLRPEYLTFWYKSAPMAGDSCGGTVTLWTTESGTKYTVAQGEWRTGATVTSMTQATITLNYDPTDGWRWADSVSISFGSSYKVGLVGAKIGSTLWIDDLQWGQGVTGVKSWNAANQNIMAFPNPSQNSITIDANQNSEAQKVIIYDLNGKLIQNSNLENGKINIQVSSWSPGTYFYQIFNKDNQIISKDQFKVIK